MIWKITAYNGTWIKSPYDDIKRSIDYFIDETGLCLLDIKLIENIH